jgi:HlyD family secretion protein
VLADLEALRVETTDLSEIDVVGVSVGQAVRISVDALPGLKLTGKVISISDAYQETRGDITYTTRIELDNTDPLLRWGMTVLVTFEEP